MVGLQATGATKHLRARFSPSVARAARDSITVTGNASIPSLAIPLSEIGISAPPPSVALARTASTSQITRYNAYRSP